MGYIIAVIASIAIGAIIGMVVTCCCVAAGKADAAAEHNMMQETCKAPEE